MKAWTYSCLAIEKQSEFLTASWNFIFFLSKLMVLFFLKHVGYFCLFSFMHPLIQKYDVSHCARHYRVNGETNIVPPLLEPLERCGESVNHHSRLWFFFAVLEEAQSTVGIKFLEPWLWLFVCLFLHVRVCLRGFGFALFAEFFAQLSTSVCALALNSSLVDLVHYTRQGFQRLKQVTKTP